MDHDAKARSDKGSARAFLRGAVLPGRRQARGLAPTLVLTLSGLVIALPAHAQTSGSEVPRAAFFAGAGVGYNHVNFGTQSIYAVGTSDNYQGGALVSSGTAAGPGTVSLSSPSTASPDVQLGYFQHFGGSAWLWGAKFSYSDLLASSTASNVGIPQAGAFTYVQSHAVVPFTGVAVINSYKTEANTRFSLIPFIGRSFNKGFVYLGIGPTITETQTSLDGLVGYAEINGANTNVSGAPQNFSSSGWVLGGAVDVGVTYFLTSSWFLDVDYTAAKTATQTGNYSSTFVNTTTNPGVTTKGTLVGSSSENIVTQSVTITINRAF